MSLSIVSPVLNSHEIVRRQILHYEKMDLPDDVEIVFVDDGSNPPLEAPNCKLKSLRIHATHDTRPWTEHIARNIGARIAKGDYLLLVDIDYIIPKDVVLECLKFRGDKMHFTRRFGILDSNGDIKYDPESLMDFGLRKRFAYTEVIPGHRSQFLMRKDLFWKLGGYREDLWGSPHPRGNGSGQFFWTKTRVWRNRGLMKFSEITPMIYVFPTGKYCHRRNKAFK